MEIICPETREILKHMQRTPKQISLNKSARIPIFSFQKQKRYFCSPASCLAKAA
jgi:hypothetical protein